MWLNWHFQPLWPYGAIQHTYLLTWEKIVILWHFFFPWVLTVKSIQLLGSFSLFVTFLLIYALHSCYVAMCWFIVSLSDVFLCEQYNFWLIDWFIYLFEMWVFCCAVYVYKAKIPRSAATCSWRRTLHRRDSTCPAAMLSSATTLSQTRSAPSSRKV